MMRSLYFTRTPELIQRLYPDLTWRQADDLVYLTFDDGPIPEVTPWVLDVLQEYNTKATFFGVGENVRRHPHIWQRILDEGHSVGHHTDHHLNAWTTPAEHYMQDVRAASKLIDSPLFRPPYGRLTRKLRKAICRDYHVVMWDILSGDFDTRLDGNRCAMRVIRHTRPGSIIVFHDSVKAWERLRIALPQVLSELSQRGFVFGRL